MIGATLAHYRITARLGAGGMGEVYRATDEKLGRDVALKLLPEDVGADPERVARFEREAKLLATLSHPNVGSIHGFEESGGRHFLVLELVEGEDLATRLSRGALPLDEMLGIASQIADGLAAAHEQGIVHRDLKPGNVMLGPEGRVKVLDFGLAKATAADAVSGSSGALSQSPTAAYQSTMAGMLLGTAAYMSPEQAKGRTAGRAADVWAFGCVVFEMLTARRAFEGDSVADTLAAVLRGEPDWSALPPSIPSGVAGVLRRCLTKDPRKRLRDVSDARLLLEEAAEARPESPGSGPRPSARWREPLAWVLVALALGAGLAAWWRAPEPVERRRVRFAFDLGTEQSLSLTDVPVLALSADGSRMAFTANDPESQRDMIFVRALDQPDPWPVAGTEGGRDPFFSPDGAQLGFFADNSLKRVALEGGTSVTLAAAPSPRGAVWARDGSIYFAPEYATGIWRVSASGGAAQEVVGPDADRAERTLRWPTMLPGGRAVLFTVGSVDNPNDYDGARIEAYDLDAGTRHVLVEGANMARMGPDERLIYWRGGTLFAITIDAEGLAPLGEATAVVEGVAGDPSSGAGYFSVADDGSLAFVPGSASAAESHVTLLDRDGGTTHLPLDPRGFRGPRFSPDGTRLAFSVGNRRGTGSRGDIWVYTLATGALNRLTFEGEAAVPVWSPDGRRIAYARADETAIYVRNADGGGAATKWTSSETEALVPGSWSPDGRLLACTLIAQPTNVYVAAEGEELRLFAEDASSPAFSPDGRWLAYASPASGNANVYVRPVEGEGRWQGSPDPGSYPRWGKGGRELYYIDTSRPERPLMMVAVEAGDAFRASPPVTLNDSLMNRFITSTAPLLNWDAAPGGERFAFVQPARDERETARIEVEVGWAQHLGRSTAR